MPIRYIPFVLVINLVTLTVVAQNPPRTSFAKNSKSAQSITFQYVSIAPSHIADENRVLFADPNGDYRALGMPLADTILFAVFSKSLEDKSRLINAPGWLWTEKFDVVARVASDERQMWHDVVEAHLGEPNPILRRMLLSMLADCCGLAVHLVPSKTAGLALTVTRYGPNRKTLTKPKLYEAIPEDAQHIPGGGRVVPITMPDIPVLHFYRTTMESFTEWLSRSGQPVENQTRLSGEYDFALRRLNTDGDPSHNWAVGALGLRFIPIVVRSQNIIVDHVGRPSSNPATPDDERRK